MRREVAMPSHSSLHLQSIGCEARAQWSVAGCGSGWVGVASGFGGNKSEAITEITSTAATVPNAMPIGTL